MPRDPKNTYPTSDQFTPIGPLRKDELKSPNRNIGLGDAPYVNRDGGSITFTSTGPKVGRAEVPNDVQARYRKFVNHAKKTGKPIPYLEYNDKRWYYQSRGKSLTNLETKLGAVAAKTAREHAKTPTLAEYKEVFGKEGQRLFDEEQAAMDKLTPGKKGTKTPKGYSRGHIRADGEGGRWHTRNLKLENTVRNAQQRQQKLTPGQENALMVGGNTNKEFLSIKGPKTKPKTTQSILRGSLKVGKPINMIGYRAMNPLMNYGTAIDEITGGHVDLYIQKGVNKIRSFLGMKPNKLRNNYK